MTANDFRAALAPLSLLLLAAARLFKQNERAVQRSANRTSRMPWRSRPA